MRDFVFDYQEFYKRFMERLKVELILEIEKWDQDYYLNFDKENYKLIVRHKRKILTEFGEITYRRRKYKHKITGEVICPTDVEFQVDGRKNMTKSLQETIYAEILEKKTNKQIKQTLPNARISISSISGILSRNEGITTQPPDDPNKKK